MLVFFAFSTAVLWNSPLLGATGADVAVPLERVTNPMTAR